VADVVTAGDIGQRLVAAIAACDGFATLVRRQLARATEQHATPLARLRPSLVCATIRWRSNSAVCSAPHTAEFERDLILQRTSEGRARAMAEGVRFGRKPKLTKHQAREALKRVAAGEPLREIALSYDVDHSTISRLKARYVAEV
jgi:hypothetical protein